MIIIVELSEKFNIADFLNYNNIISIMFKNYKKIG